MDPAYIAGISAGGALFTSLTAYLAGKKRATSPAISPALASEHINDSDPDAPPSKPTQEATLPEVTAITDLSQGITDTSHRWYDRVRIDAAYTDEYGDVQTIEAYGWLSAIMNHYDVDAYDSDGHLIADAKPREMKTEEIAAYAASIVAEQFPHLFPTPSVVIPHT